MSSLKSYNPWAKHVYDRIQGKQKTRKKKAAIALARKIAVLAWALLRDGKDWDPKQMLDVTESFGRVSPALKETLKTMKPKESKVVPDLGEPMIIGTGKGCIVLQSVASDGFAPQATPNIGLAVLGIVRRVLC